MNQHGVAVRSILSHFPAAQAIYLLGLYEAAEGWEDAEMDFGILLPEGVAIGGLAEAAEACRRELVAALGQPVDLVNCRAVPLAIQREIVANGTLLFTGDADAVAEFQRKATSVLEWTGEGGSLFLSPP